MNIKTELEALSKLLLDKGCASVDLQFLIRTDVEYRGEVNYYPDDNYQGYQSIYFHGDTEDEVLKKMRQHIYALPSLAERQRNEYLKKLGSAVEYGKKIGLDEHLINPLELQMKKLSGNIIEYHENTNYVVQSANHDLNDEIPF